MSIHNNGDNYNRRPKAKMSFNQNDDDRKASSANIILTAVEVRNPNARGIIREQLGNLEDEDIDNIYKKNIKAYMMIGLEKNLLEIERGWTKEEIRRKTNSFSRANSEIETSTFSDIIYRSVKGSQTIYADCKRKKKNEDENVRDSADKTWNKHIAIKIEELKTDRKTLEATVSTMCDIARMEAVESQIEIDSEFNNIS